MFTRFKLSLSRINYKLYLALLVLGLCPTIYTTVRVFFLGQLPGEWSYSIAGQLSWVNLLYEIMNESIILPLYYFVGKVKEDKNEFSNRVRTGMLISFCVYAVQNVFDSTFYGLGKTNYMLFESVMTNTIYYGGAFALYITGVWEPTLTGIALLFGIGNAFDSIVSLGVYVFFLKKNRINIFNSI